MTADWWQRVYDLFHEALPLPPEERRALLEARCADDPKLRSEVERLLDRDAQAEREDFLAPPHETTRDGLMVAQTQAIKIHCPNCGIGIELLDFMVVDRVECPSCHSNVTIQHPVTMPWSTQPGSNRIARYMLVETVGMGAYGTVYRAYDPELQRDVAIKLLRVGNLGLDDRAARFMEEARSSAQLHHRAIVPIHDADEFEGIPYIVSDFIPGVTLAESLRTRLPTFREAARLAAELADALHYAHENGVIHRDVKSQNIMLSRDGQPHLMDFGLAKREASEVVITIEGQILGTPAYMPPEQASGKLSKVDRKSDVYSLGVVLYQMICGELPFRGTTPMLLHQVLHDEPRPPRKLNDRIPRNLETICLKSMAKEAGSRYHDAAELRDDLRRFLDDKPIKARPATASERGWRWCRRNPVVAGLLGATAVSLLAASVFSVLYAVSRSRMLTESNRNLAQVSFDLGHAECERGEVGPGLHWLLRSANAAIAAGDRSLTRIAWDNLAAWQSEYPKLKAVFSHAGELKDAAFSPDGATVITASADRTARLWNVATRAPIGQPLTHQHAVSQVRFSPDGQLVLTTSKGGEARLWDPRTGSQIHNLVGHRGEVSQGVFSRDSKTLVTVGEDKTGRIWNVADGRLLHILTGHLDRVDSVAISPDGRTVLTGSDDHKARLWDVDTGKLRGEPLLHDDKLMTVELSPDGRTALTCSFDHTARLWDVATGKPLQRLTHDSEVWVAAFSPDGRTVATAGKDRTARLWDVVSGEHRGDIMRHDDPVCAVVFSPDGKRLATASWDHTARLWNVATGRPLGRPFRHQGWVRDVEFSSDGQTVLTAGGDGSAKLWDAPPSELAFRELPMPGLVRYAAYSPDGTQILLGGENRELLICDAATTTPRGAPIPNGESVSAIAWSPDGKLLAVGGEHGKAQLWDVAQGRTRGTPLQFDQDAVPEQNAVHAIAFSPDGKTVLFSSLDSTARLCDTLTGQARGGLLRNNGKIFTCTFSKDSSTAVTAGLGGTIGLWDSLTGQPKLTSLPHPDNILSVEFSPDGKMLLTGCLDGSARLWNFATSELIGKPFQLEGGVVCVAFSPDGKTILTGGLEGRAILWDVASGTRKGQPLLHESAVIAMAFSPNGQFVMTASRDGTARIWDPAIGLPLGPPLRHPRNPYGDPFEVQGIAFSPDGGAVLTNGEDRTARVWNFAQFTQASPLSSPQLEAITGLTLDDRGVVHVLDTDTWNARRRVFDSRPR
jgi:WD40 repeat protein/serine/threonine protein kinase